jgi:DNA-binding IclR family transcriptional regulator
VTGQKDLVSKQPSQTLAKALLILEAFTAEQPEWGIRELGRELDINPTSVYRLVATFQNVGFLDQDRETQRYSLGPKVLKLASVYEQQNPLPKIARRVFESFSDRFEYNFYLGVLSHFEVVYLAALDGRGPIKIVVETGGTTALHTTALGKVLLAFQDDQFVERFLATTKLEAFTPRSITTEEVLWAQIRQIRQHEFAVNEGEHFEDVAAVGVPVLEQTGKVTMGVSLAYPRHLVREKRIRIEELIPLAREVSREITVRSEGVLPVGPALLD